MNVKEKEEEENPKGTEAVGLVYHIGTLERRTRGHELYRWPLESAAALLLSPAAAAASAEVEPVVIEEAKEAADESGTDAEDAEDAAVDPPMEATPVAAVPLP